MPRILRLVPVLATLWTPAAAHAFGWEDWSDTDIALFWQPVPVTANHHVVASTPKGDGTVDFPIATPPARLGLPLSLHYGGQQPDDRLLGLGWALSLPHIVRDTSLGVPAYDTTDSFMGPDGPLVEVAVDTWRPEADLTGARRVYAYDATNDRWTVTGKTGLIETYEPVVVGPSGTADWGLTRLANPYGDEVLVEWDSGGLPVEITYGGNPLTGDAAEYSVNFEYTVRDCPRSTWRAGFEDRHQNVIEFISVKKSSTTLRRYDLAWNDCPDVLGSITERGYSDAGPLARQPWTFSYADGGTLQATSYTGVPTSLSTTYAEYTWYDDGTGWPESELDRHRQTLGVSDANGDPLPDFVNLVGVSAGQLPTDSHAFGSVVFPHADTLGSLESVSPTSVSGLDALDVTARLADVDGDGFTDLVRLAATATVLWGGPDGLGTDETEVAFPDGDWSLGRTAGGPTYGNEYQIRDLVDVTGDGALDVVATAWDEPYVSIWRWDRAAGGWSDVEESHFAPWCDGIGLEYCFLRWATVVHNSATGDSASSTHAALVDANGDGLADVVASGSAQWTIWWNTGDGWDEDYDVWYDAPGLQTHSEDVSPLGTGGTFCTEQMVLDVDGDGLPDVANAPENLWIRNTGSGFEERTLFSGTGAPLCLLGGTFTKDSDVTNWKCVDECDDLEDEIEACVDDNCSEECEDTGSACADCVDQWEEDCPELEFEECCGGLPASGIMESTRRVTFDVRDWNGDRGADLLDATTGKLWSLNRPAGTLLMAIDRSPGLSELSWQHSGDVEPAGDWTRTQHLPVAVPVLEAIDETDPITGQSWSTEYFWADGDYDTDRRRFLGFGTECRIESLDKIACFDRITEWPLTGLTLEETRGAFLALQYRRTLSPLWITNPEPETTLVLPFVETIEQSAEDGTNTRTKTAEWFWDAEGNLANVDILGELPGPQDDTTVVMTWADPGDNGLVVPCEMEVSGWDDRAGVWAVASQRTFAYDDLTTPCTASQGSLTSVSHLRKGYGLTPAWRTFELVRDAYGHVEQVTSPGGAVSTQVWDVSHRYVAEATDPVGLVTLETQDDWGNVLTRESPSGREETWDYDGFGRAIAHDVGDGTVVPHAIETWTHDDSPTPHSERIGWLGGVSVEHTATWFNAWREPVQVRSKNSATNYLVVDTSYTAAGQIERTGRPYTAAGASFSGFGAASAVEHDYDGLGRWEQTTDLLGGVMEEVGGQPWEVTVEDQGGDRRHEVYDSYGRLVEAWVDDDGSPLGNGTYAYDALGQLLWAIDPDGIRTDLWWSSTGELLRLQSPDVGTYTFDYDNDGNLVFRGDSTGRQVRWTRDAAGRIEEVRSGFGGAVLEETWEWDLDVPGTLSRVTDRAGVVEYDYDARGRTIGETRTFPDASVATTNQTWDDFDRVVTVTHPDGVLETRFFAYGYPSRIDARSASGITRTLATFTRNAAGEMTGFTSSFGLNVEVTRDGAGRIEELDWHLGATQKGVLYTWTPTSRLASRTWSAPVLYPTNYTYDAAGRLIGATGAEPGSWTWTAGGDPVSATIGTAPWTFTRHAGTHRIATRMSGTTGASYAYDAAGRVVTEQPLPSGTPTSTSYDARGQPTLVQRGTTKWERSYDYKGAPVWELVNGVRVARQGAWERTGTSTRTTVRADGLPLARFINGNTLQVVMTDAQGTRMATTNLSGSVQTLLKTDVWGREISSSAARDDLAHFTGLANSPALGLIGPAARFYEPASFAFQSPDPLWFGPQIATHLQDDPFGMHPYRYALAAPGVFTDRNGAAVETFWDIAVVGVDVVVIGWDGEVTQDEWGMFAVDAASLFIPGLPAGGGLVGLGARAMFLVDKLPPPARDKVLLGIVYAYRAMSKGSTMQSSADEFIRGMKLENEMAKGARAARVPEAAHVPGSGAPRLSDGLGAGAAKGTDGTRFVGEPNSTLVDTTATPRGSYDQPGGGRTDVLQREDHGAGHSHTHDPIKNTNPKTGETFINGLDRTGRPVSAEDVENIVNGVATPSTPKGR